MDQRIIRLDAHEMTVPCQEKLSEEEGAFLATKRTHHIYDLVAAQPKNIFVFTSSGAEAINQTLLSVFLKVSRTTGKCHFITSQTEDAATLQMMKRLEELGCYVKIAPVDGKGEVIVSELEKLISPRTALISLSMAQGLTGVIQPIEEIAEMIKDKGVLLHLDATYVAGKYYFSFDDLGADYLTFSGDRLHAEPNTGALFAKPTAPLVPLILGDATLRAGAIHSPSLLSLCNASLQALMHLDPMCLEISRLRDAFEQKILAVIPEAQILFKDSLRLPNTTVIAFPNVHQEALWQWLKVHRVHASIGGVTTQHLSSLLMASSMEAHLALTAISFSMTRMSTEEELNEAVSILKKGVQQLQKVSWNLEIHPTKMAPPTPKCIDKLCQLQFAGTLSSAEGMRRVIGLDRSMSLSLLIDETDGVIADAKFQAFGPTALLAAMEVTAELLIRKNTVQASRISAELIYKELKDKKDEAPISKEWGSLLNQILGCIDMALEQCQDITPSTDYAETPIAIETEGEGIIGWETFPLSQKKELIEEIINKEIRPYVEMDAGGVNIVQLTEQDELVIAYEGACTSCHSATGSTLGAIQQILRAKASPTLTVIPQL